jgi:hypothetical protein
MTEAAPFVPEEPTDDIPGVRYYEIPAGATIRRVGKKAAGRPLDGRTWDEYPRVAP